MGTRVLGSTSTYVSGTALRLGPEQWHLGLRHKHKTNLKSTKVGLDNPILVPGSLVPQLGSTEARPRNRCSCFDPRHLSLSPSRLGLGP